MRKILLASTALVALGVSAASADISISGNGKWSYTNNSKSTDNASVSGDSMSTAMAITVASSFASDSGLTYGTSHSLSNGNNDGKKIYVSGSFGEVRIGGDSAGAAFDVDPSVADGESATHGATAFHGAPTTAKVTDDGISYFTPSINGFSAGVSFGDAGAGHGENGDVTEMGASYSQTVGDATIKVSYAARDTSASNPGGTDGSEATSMGATITMGDLSVTVAANTQTKDDTSSNGDESGTGIGLSYVLSEGLTLKAHTVSSDDDADSTVDNSETAASLTYVVAPGLTANVAYTDSESGTTTGTATTAYLKVAF